jgi:hypothetical protein
MAVHDRISVKLSVLVVLTFGVCVVRAEPPNASAPLRPKTS